MTLKYPEILDRLIKPFLLHLLLKFICHIRAILASANVIFQNVHTALIIKFNICITYQLDRTLIRSTMDPARMFYRSRSTLD